MYNDMIKILWYENDMEMWFILTFLEENHCKMN